MSTMSTTTTEIPAVMTLQEAADLLQLHHTTLRAAIKEGRLRASMPDRRKYRLTREQIQQWLADTTTR